MVLAKLLGYAVGSVVFYWGLLLFLIAPWLLALLLITLINFIWNQVTGKTDEWKWFMNWSVSTLETVHRLKFEWVGWIPGVFIQIWYAGYAANLVQTSAIEKTTAEALILQIMGGIGIIAATKIFYWIYHSAVEVKLSKWVYILVGGISLVSYFVFLQQPHVAEELGRSWQKVFAALLSAMM